MIAERTVGECIDHGRFGFSYLRTLGADCVLRSRGFARACAAASRPARGVRRPARRIGRFVPALVRSGAEPSDDCRGACPRRAPIRRPVQPLSAWRPRSRGDARDPGPACQRRCAHARARGRRRLPARGLHSSRYRPLQRRARAEPRAASPCSGFAAFFFHTALSQLTLRPEGDRTDRSFQSPSVQPSFMPADSEGSRTLPRRPAQ